MIVAFLLHVFTYCFHHSSTLHLPGTHQLCALFMQMCMCLCVLYLRLHDIQLNKDHKEEYSLSTKRKPEASSYLPLNQNTEECTFRNGASLFRIKGELTGCKASFPFTNLLLHAEHAALDLGLCPQLGQTGLNGAVTIYATEDAALGMQLREHLSQPPPSACTSSLWQPHFTMDGRLCPKGGWGIQKKLLPALLS